jgi:hypothetical protein
MRNKIKLGTYLAMGFAVTLVDSGNAISANVSSSARNAARKECVAQIGINVDFKGGQKMTCTQLVAMDTCMKAHGVHVGRRVSCGNE